MSLKTVLVPLQQEVIKVRRDLHAIPELGFKEVKTSAYVAAALRRQGLSVTTGIAGTGVVGLLETSRPGPTLLIRADMDALPLAEETGLDFASGHPGAMHACGHDAHMAMALTAAAALVGLKDKLCGNIKFVFQPAEEGPGGAQPMIDAGVLDHPKVDYALGCHLWSVIPAGTIGIRSGALMAAASRFFITIHGKGGHAAHPHLCVDALEVGCQVVGALQRIVSRQMDPLAPTVITVGRFEAGTTFNIIPETATIAGTARTFDKETWQQWPLIIGKVVEGVCDAMGASYEAEYEEGYPPLVNDDKMAARMSKVAAAVVGADQVVTPDQSLGGEDMACFLDEVPGCFFCLGVDGPDHAGVHNPKFDFDEAVLINGVEMYCRAALELLGTGNST